MLTMEGSFDFLNRGIHLTANCFIGQVVGRGGEADEVRSSYMNGCHVCEIDTIISL
jgi:hypothetical protein